MSGAPEPSLDVQLRYAWDWFQYHAGQRLTAFNFFLILMGAVLVGYANAATGDSPVLGVTVAAIGLVVSAGFLAMDLRNAELVQYGRDALEDLETRYPTLPQIRTGDAQRKALETAMKGWWVVPSSCQGKARVTHGYWLRRIIILFGIISILGLGWAVAGFPGN